MKKVLLTGGNGFLGSHVWNQLSKEFEVFRFSSNELDLTNKEKTNQYFKEISPDIVIHMAARLGGIGDNISNPLAYYETNTSLGMNVLSACKLNNVDHLINIGTVCSYPKTPSIPFKEEELWLGIPEESNKYYGLAKRSIIDYGMVLSESNNLNVTNLLMANLYGIGDDFRPKTSHVIPAIIKKVDDINLNGTLKVWGDGTPSRDFLNVQDAAKIIKKVSIEGFKSSFPINVGTGSETTIAEVVEIIVSAFPEKNIEIDFTTNQPNGQPRRVLNIDRLKSLYNIKPLINIKDGIEEFVHWYGINKSALTGLADKYDS